MCYYLAHIRQTDGKHKAVLQVPGRAKDLTAARKQLEKLYPPDKTQILDLNEISEESFWFCQQLSDQLCSLHFEIRLLESELEDAKGEKE